MRRAILAVFAGGMLLSSAACSDDPKSSVAAPGATVPTASAAPAVSASAPDYTAGNRAVCDRLDEVFTFSGFGGALGKMIAHKEADDTANADKAEKQAAGVLKAVGAQIRKETDSVEDPELKALATASAERIEASAKDLDFIEKIESTKDLDRSTQDQIAEWIAPIAGYCGANRAAAGSPGESASAAPTGSPETSPSTP